FEVERASDAATASRSGPGLPNWKNSSSVAYRRRETSSWTPMETTSAGPSRLTDVTGDLSSGQKPIWENTSAPNWSTSSGVDENTETIPMWLPAATKSSFCTTYSREKPNTSDHISIPPSFHREIPEYPGWTVRRPSSLRNVANAQRGHSD